MRRTWALVDVFTMLKRRGNLPPPTAELILRKFDGLSLLALDNLSMLMEYTIAEQGRRLCPDQVCAMAQAVRVFPEDTASEIAHAHACESVASADGVKRESHEGSHLLRLPTLPDTPHAELPEPVCRVENVVSLHTRGGIPHPSPWAPGGIQLTFQHPEGVQLRSSSHCRKSGARTAVGFTVLALSLHLEEMRLFSSDIHTQSTHSVPYSRGCVVRWACRLLA